MPISTSTTSGYPNDTGGVMRIADTSDAVDNVFIFQDTDGTKWERIVEGGRYRAQWACQADGSNQLSRVNTILSHTSVQELVLDFPTGGGMTLTGSLTVPTGKKISFQTGCYITGTCTITNGTYFGPIDQKWFDTTVTLSSPRVDTPFFPVHAYGATGSGAGNDQTAIQKAVDTVILNVSLPRDLYFLPGKTYRTTSPILCQHWDAVAVKYQNSTINLIGNYGDGDMKFSAIGATIFCTSTDTFAVGFHICKSGGVKGMSIIGAFTNPSLTLLQFYNTAFDSYLDPGTRDTRFSPYSAIVIDPWRNVGGVVPPDGGYPGMSIYYTQGVNNVSNSGSSGLVFEDLYMSNFTVCGLHSPNGQTQNDECMTWRDIQVANCKVGFSSCQDQEKSNVFDNIICWGITHTLFTNTHYGLHNSSNVYISNVNVAGQVYQIVDWSAGGSFPSYFRNIYSEGAARVGIIQNGGLAVHFSDCLFDVIRPHDLGTGGAFVDYHIHATRGVTFDNCTIRIYVGEPFPVILAGEGALYRECCFETPPHVPIMAELTSAEGPRFENCTLSLTGGILGATGKFSAQLSGLSGFTSYGDYTAINSVQSQNGFNYEFEFNGDRVRSQAPLGSFAITVSGTPRTFSFNAGSLAEFFHAYYTVVLNTGATYLFGGMVTSVVGTTVTVTYVPLSVANGTYDIFVTAPLPIFGFMGSTTSGNATITGVVPDSFGFQEGQTIWSDLFYGFAKIVDYDSGAATVLMSVVAQATQTNVYFSPYNSRKSLRTLKGVQTDLTSVPNATLFHKGSLIIDNQSGIEIKYLCCKTGYFNQTPYAVFSGMAFTIAADTSRPYPLDAKISFLVKPASNLSNFKIGTTNGGEEIFSAQPITGGVWNDIDVRHYNETGALVYFGGLGTTSTQIKMIVYPVT